MRTIIQHIGPLYGELNTGSVFGQPNGSIAVSQNLVPTPEPPTSDESVIWTITEYSGYSYFTVVSSLFYWSFNSSDGLTNTDSRLCIVRLLSDITDTNTTVRLQIANDESFSSIEWEGIISYSTSDSYVAPSFNGSSYPVFTDKKVYYLRLLLYSSGGTYLSKKSNTLSLTYKK